jgi:hypothetical protein
VPAQLLLSGAFNQRINQTAKIKAHIGAAHPGCDQPAPEHNAHARVELFQASDKLRSSRANRTCLDSLLQ